MVWDGLGGSCPPCELWDSVRDREREPSMEYEDESEAVRERERRVMQDDATERGREAGQTSENKQKKTKNKEQTNK